ncbi:hypothetical protein QQZ08_002721 [Neonectria magnoliae]|uniref:Ankyrin n=1 Tax=Neonectria magnoliae TaxID=2732573 RepID=A0ABR1IAT2_9HYPO
MGLLSYTKELLNSTAVDILDGENKTPLWWAADGGHTAVIRALIASGANPDLSDNGTNRTPLHLAAISNTHETVKVLLSVVVYPLTPKTRPTYGSGLTDFRSTPGRTAVEMACQQAHLEAVELFLPLLKDSASVHQALVWATEMRRETVVARLLQCPGVDVNAKVNHNTLLFVACGNPDVATISTLLHAGADPNIDCQSGYDDSHVA